MRKRRILMFLILVALLVAFSLPIFLKPQQFSQAPIPLALSVHQQSLNLKIEEGFAVDINGDGQAELVLRDAATKKIHLAQWRGDHWTIKPLPIPSKSTLPTNSIPRLDTGLIPEDTMKGKELLRFSDLKCLPVLLPDRKVVVLRCDEKGNLRIQTLVRNAHFMLAGDLNGDGQQDDLIVGVLPKRLLWFVAKNDALSLRQEINTSSSVKASAWGQVTDADFGKHRITVSFASGTTEAYAVWHGRLVPDTGGVYGDFDGDGIVDRANHTSKELQIWLSKFRKEFKLPCAPPDEWWAIGDLDYDGLVEVVMSDGNRLVCWGMQPSGEFRSLVIQKPMAEIYGIGDVDNDGQEEVILLHNPRPHPVLDLLRWALLNLSLMRPPLPELMLVWKSGEGWRWKTCKILSTPSPRQGYDIKATRFYGFMSTRTPRGVCRFGGRWWLFASSNSGISMSCFTCRFGRVFAALRGGYSICPHCRNEYWQETRLWSVQGDKAIEMLKLDAILAH
ncbi:MAG: FG-GAP repeat domain-containing protein, partial [Armatimonadota bacterium]